MVDLFFVLSGFVIALNYSDRLSTLREVWDFQQKRFCRLYPLHLATLIAFIGLEQARELSGISLHNPSNFNALISHIFLIQSMTGNQSSFNIPSWSISVEFYTYLLFALILLTKFRLWIICGAIACIFCLLNIVQPDHPLDSLLFPRCVYGFFIGVIAFNIYKLIPKFNSSIISTILLLMSGFGVSMLGGTKFDIYVPFIFATTIVSISRLDEATIIYRVLSHKAFVWIGTISYSIYMVHGLVWAVVGSMLRLMISTTVVDGTRVFHLSNFEALGVTILSLGLLLWVSNYSFRLIEIRFYKARF